MQLSETRVSPRPKKKETRSPQITDTPRVLELKAMNGKPDKNCMRCGGKGRMYSYSKKLDCVCLNRTTPLPERVKCPACGSLSTRRADGKPGELMLHGSLGWGCNGLERRTW